MRLGKFIQIFSQKKIAYYLGCALLVFGLMIFSVSCRKNSPTDMRRFAPAESIVYLETADLKRMLSALTESGYFKNNPAKTPDFSYFENTQAAIIITNFTASEKQLTDNAASLNFKPQFALIADTHAWEQTNLALVDNQIGSFAGRIFGDEVKLEKYISGDAKIYLWSSGKDRQLIAAVAGNLIYISNSEKVLTECLAVKNGKKPNLVENEKIAQIRSQNNSESLVYGFVSKEGINQISNFYGAMTAVSASDEAVSRSYIADLLPKFIQNTANEIVWTAKKNETQVEDKLSIKVDSETASIWQETFAPNSNGEIESAKFIPAAFYSLTRYNFKNPQIAWRSALITATAKIEKINPLVVTEFSKSALNSFAVEDPEKFLASAGDEIITVRFDRDGEKDAAIVEIKDLEKIKSAVSKEINLAKKPEKISEAEIWKSADEQSAAAFAGNYLIIGNTESVLKCLQTSQRGESFSAREVIKNLPKFEANATTIGRDFEADKVIGVLTKSESKSDYQSYYTTETRFTNNGIERRSVSDFGLIGEIIKRFSTD